MTIKRASRIKLISFTSLLIYSSLAYAGQYNAILDIGDPMPSFTNLPAISGNTLSTQDLTEDILIFVSLANHCPWVQGMDQDLVALSKEFKNKSVRIVGLSMNHREDDRLPAMKIHAQKVGYDFDYVYDESQALARSLGATRTPEYFVFNKERELIYMGALYNSPAKMNTDGSIKHINGEPSEHYVSNAIHSALTGKPIDPAETRAHGCTVKYVQ